MKVIDETKGRKEMKVIDTDLIEAFLANYPHYASITYEASKHRKGGVEWEYMVYEMDGMGEGITLRFADIEALERWLIEHTNRVDI